MGLRAYYSSSLGWKLLKSSNKAIPVILNNKTSNSTTCFIDKFLAKLLKIMLTSHFNTLIEDVQLSLFLVIYLIISVRMWQLIYIIDLLLIWLWLCKYSSGFRFKEIKVINLLNLSLMRLL